jgi:hypothetical protein
LKRYREDKSGGRRTRTRTRRKTRRKRRKMFDEDGLRYGCICGGALLGRRRQGKRKAGLCGGWRVEGGGRWCKKCDRRELQAGTSSHTYSAASC